MQLDSIAGDGRTGVSLDNDGNGNGYNLVFHESTSGLAVQLLNDQRSWSSVAIYTDSDGNLWRLSTYYTFQLVVVPQGDGVDALFGKVWLTGTAEPAQWTIEEIQGSGLSRSPGLPALEGGSSGSGGYATADFQPVNGTTGSLVWAVTPSLFSSVDSTRWQSLQGTWSQSERSVPASGHIEQHEQAGDLPDGWNRALLHDDHLGSDSVDEPHQS